MRDIHIDFYKLILSTGLFVLTSLIGTSLFIILVTGEASLLFNAVLHLHGISLLFSVVMMLVLPLLVIRTVIYFYLMAWRGRREGIGLVSKQNLFNPMNFLLFPSLLSLNGLLYRRRCIVSILFIGLLYCMSLYL